MLLDVQRCVFAVLKKQYATLLNAVIQYLWLKLMYYMFMGMFVIDRDTLWKILHLGTPLNGSMMTCVGMYQTAGNAYICECMYVCS